jgi:hypothetical protein
MFDFVKNLDIIEQACEQFVKSHETFYNFTKDISTPSIYLVPEIAKYPNLRL